MRHDFTDALGRYAADSVATTVPPDIGLGPQGASSRNIVTDEENGEFMGEVTRNIDFPCYGADRQEMAENSHCNGVTDRHPPDASPEFEVEL